MFYGWEDFKGDFRRSERVEAGEALIGDAMESVADLRRQIEFMSRDARVKDASIAKLQRELESTSAALVSEQAKHAETMARNLELERELEERIMQERGLVKQLEDQGDKHDKEMAEVKAWYENEIQRLVDSLETLEDAEERLVAQLGDLEAEAMEQNRYFNAEIGSLSQSLARKEQELASSQTELESIRQRQISLKELEAMDLAAQLLKSTNECDKMRLRTESLQGEMERVKTKASNLQQELALAKLVSSWQQENKSIQEEKIRAPSQLCRSESLSLGTQRRARHTAVAV
ncbi:hypothetical protein M758_7G145500 [Ceratodon purpureus]|uniref:Uncharacterized protein n=1 Tax=Ceratodon purpureus TaxID=3225 RepID=A0A8T0H9P6_CERPU|nr:hypothetical protein KC19_7G132600 [Ceratodon purpureus]KAG0611512.1 hypothetical protein M758_7G145500 [Ceratodon purpureus]